MPKVKTHSASKKRFSLTKNGLVKRGQMGKRHILTKKSTKRKRNLRKRAYADQTVAATIRTMMPYK
jgi:large subunit ribosomal protein L35